MRHHLLIIVSSIRTLCFRRWRLHVIAHSTPREQRMCHARRKRDGRDRRDGGGRVNAMRLFRGEGGSSSQTHAQSLYIIVNHLRRYYVVILVHDRAVGPRLARRLVFGACLASPPCLRLPGRCAFSASPGDWRAFGASTATPFGRKLRRGEKT